jgi:DNA-binding PadR family transcriptional regulator
MGKRTSTDEASTLTPLMFQILVALTQGERHGYAIMQEIEDRTQGEFTIGAGTLYRSIKKLVDAGYISEVTPEVREHRQRRTYLLTPSGRDRAASEARVFDGIAAWARDAELLDTQGS